MKERIFTTKEQGRVLVEAGLPISTAIGFRDKYLDQIDRDLNAAINIQAVGVDAAIRTQSSRVASCVEASKME